MCGPTEVVRKFPGMYVVLRESLEREGERERGRDRQREKEREAREREREGPRLRVATVRSGAPRSQAAGCLVRLQLPRTPHSR